MQRFNAVPRLLGKSYCYAIFCLDIVSILSLNRVSILVAITEEVVVVWFHQQTNMAKIPLVNDVVFACKTGFVQPLFAFINIWIGCRPLQLIHGSLSDASRTA